jgi:hypothetical protein
MSLDLSIQNTQLFSPGLQFYVSIWILMEWLEFLDRTITSHILKPLTSLVKSSLFLGVPVPHTTSWECRYDERQKAKPEGSTRFVYTGLIGGLEHLKIETRLIDERFASVMGECDCEVIDSPSRLSLIRKGESLTRVLPPLDLNCEKNVAWRKWNSPLVDCGRWTPEAAKKLKRGQFPDESVRTKDTT